MDKILRKNTQQTKIKFNLKAKMVSLISTLIIGIFIVFAFFLHSFVSNTTEDQIGRRALSVAESVANIPEVKQAFLLEDPAAVIQNIVMPIQEKIEAEFIVVGNTDSIRYSHPDTEKIGKKMIGADNNRALFHGESYVSIAEGSLGLSIRGKAPVHSEEGEITGVVSVGFLNENIQDIITAQNYKLLLTLFIIILIGIIGAIFISHYIKKQLSNLEPEEISNLMIEKESILQSTHEGIVAIDNNGVITMINLSAQQLLLKKIVNQNNYIGKPIQSMFPHSTIFHMFEHGKHMYDREMVLGENVLLVNQTPMYRDNTLIGTVLTFRDKTELEGVIHELSRVKQYANAQRAQTHEFSNKLYTILGFLQLNQYEEAVDFIKRNSEIREKWEQFLTNHFTDPIIHAILQGKFNQANELGVHMTLHPDSQLSYRFSEDEKDVLLTVLGNLIENAIEAVKNQAADQRNVSILFTDIGEDIIIEIEDSGPGIPETDIPYIFSQGFSTKNGSNRGIGLALSSQTIRRINGQILLEEGDMGGACFVMIIPKKGVHADE
ncbi:ATP-binding protein [Oceanobacillus sp. FSL H7-0719]|uniref:ATP-binding protein n=1 Tax=Oceanobacillus sp. FSL H7-0719 TaxID=2954507 RepID=UPI0032435DE4